SELRDSCEPPDLPEACREETTEPVHRGNDKPHLEPPSGTAFLQHRIQMFRRSDRLPKTPAPLHVFRRRMPRQRHNVPAKPPPCASPEMEKNHFRSKTLCPRRSPETSPPRGGGP